MNTPDLTTLEGIQLDGSEPVFSEPWEAQAFSLVIGLYEKGAFSWTEWARVLSETIAKDTGCKPYYELWLEACEAITLEKQLLVQDEIELRKEDWKLALDATPHGEPIELSNVSN